ncbi:MAG: YfiR family protein [Vicinamibacterales bacterium]
MNPVLRPALVTLLSTTAAVCLIAFEGRPAAEQASEHEVKATFLFNFLKFAAWPPSALGEGWPLEICLSGESAVLPGLEVFRNRVINGHALNVRRVVDPADLQFCHVVFFAEAEARRTPAALAGLGGAPVLTVGEDSRFLEQGGIINFVSEDNRVRFDINQTAAERANLKISAHLLRLARRTIGRRS